MLSSRAGTRCGTRIGSALGVQADPIAPDGEAPEPPETTTLTVAISDSADPVISEVQYDYSIVVTNTGAIDATNVVATITLDATLTYVTGSGTDWSVGHSSGVVTCTRATLAPGAAPTISITVSTAAASSTETTTADADADNSDPAVQDSETTVVALVDRDATSGIRCPRNGSQWASFIAYHGLTIAAPLYTWGCQDASGNLAEADGGPVLTASGTPSYSNAVAGWTRVAVGTTDGTAGQRLRTSDASLPDISTTSAFLLAYCALTGTPAGIRGVLELGTTQAECRATTTPTYRNVAGGVTTTGASNPGTSVRPVGLAMRPATDQSCVYTDQEKIESATTVTTPTGKIAGFGATGGASAPPARLLYAVLFVDDPSAAEIKALYQALGWTVPW